jgi:hypothetical protein
MKVNVKDLVAAVVLATLGMCLIGLSLFMSKVYKSLAMDSTLKCCQHLRAYSFFTGLGGCFPAPSNVLKFEKGNTTSREL